MQIIPNIGLDVIFVMMVRMHILNILFLTPVAHIDVSCTYMLHWYSVIAIYVEKYYKRGQS